MIAGISHRRFTLQLTQGQPVLIKSDPEIRQSAVNTGCCYTTPARRKTPWQTVEVYDHLSLLRGNTDD